MSSRDILISSLPIELVDVKLEIRRRKNEMEINSFCLFYHNLVWNEKCILLIRCLQWSSEATLQILNAVQIESEGTKTWIYACCDPPQGHREHIGNVCAGSLRDVVITLIENAHGSSGFTHCNQKLVWYSPVISTLCVCVYSIYWSNQSLKIDPLLIMAPVKCWDILKFW